MSNLYLDELENESIRVIREAYWRYKNKLAVLWSMGKDSTTMLHLVRKSFFGEVPFPVIHIDTSFKFKEIYEFRDKYAKKWKLNLVIARNEAALQRSVCPSKGLFECCNTLKTEALKQAIDQNKLEALLLAIRRDEHSIRAKERYLSPRDANFSWNYQQQPLEMRGEINFPAVTAGIHFRVHPMLAWREIDIWRYTKRERLPVINLYFAKSGKRFRSIGCATCCEPVVSRANDINKVINELESTKIAERSGRCQDKEKEYMMQKLRSLGYM